MIARPPTIGGIYMVRMMYGVGINDADYKTRGCPFYNKWKSMMCRCYSVLYHKMHPTYLDCEVCDDWKLFSNFRNWMITQDYIGKQLDKDLLVIGNKIYGPNTCVFITSQINNFIQIIPTDKYNLPVGVLKKGKKFQSSIREPITKK